MASWMIDAPTRLDFDEITALNVRMAAGTVAVLATDDQPALVVTELTGRPLRVSQDGGTLTVSHEFLTWEGLLSFRRPRYDAAAVTITVPADCPVQLGVLSAAAVVSGLCSGASVRALSGDITLDGVAGDVTAETMSGEVSACDADGTIRLKSMSGGLTLASGWLDALEANTMSGQITADVSLSPVGDVRISTLSGDVKLRLPSDVDARIRLQSATGAVHSEFGTLRSLRAPASHTVSGNVGAGTGRVSVTTMSGSVALLRRSPVEMESNTR